MFTRPLFAILFSLWLVLVPWSWGEQPVSSGNSEGPPGIPTLDTTQPQQQITQPTATGGYGVPAFAPPYAYGMPTPMTAPQAYGGYGYGAPQPQSTYVPPPQWSEFCPSQYLGAQAQAVGSYNKLGNVALAATVVGAPFAIANRKNFDDAKERNYWVMRRLNFENSVRSCQSVYDPNMQLNCYMQLRQLEQSKNAQHSSELAAVTQQRLQRQMLLNSIGDNNSYSPRHCRSDGLGGFNCY